ncbi:MAG: hypothetical protein AAB337_03870 [Patescibacteria group bacterium]
MNFSKFIISFVIVVLLPASVSAHMVETPVNILPTLNSSSWLKIGAVTVATNGLTATISETSATRGNLYTDISISNTTKDYVLLIAYTNAEDVRSDGDITGLPYIYGYFLDKNGKIISYLQKDNMRHSSTVDGAWDVSNGVFEIPSGAVKIRYFMKQASKKGTYKDGRDATFAKPGVYLVDRPPQALDIISEYKSHLGNIWE